MDQNLWGFPYARKYSSIELHPCSNSLIFKSLLKIFCSFSMLLTVFVCLLVLFLGGVFLVL